MKRTILAIVYAFVLTTAAKAQELIYEKYDSIFIENITTALSQRKFKDNGKRIIAIAERFLGQKYVSGTLENGLTEPLYVSCTKLDCTTFVELVVAIELAIEKGSSSFYDVCRELEKVRYRNGVRRGYSSRLHYISWWATDNEKLGILKEVTKCPHSKDYCLNLSFMSSHKENYPLLKDNPEIAKAIEELEKPYRNSTSQYIAKEHLNKGQNELPIKDGDIVALVTEIEGLDVTHIGFAFWKDEHLHLLHASSGKGVVIKDSESLYNYQANKKSHTGIRVFRMIQ